jgi:hypothetical protein
MTISISVKNTDSRETAVVSVKTVNNGVQSVMPIVNRTGTELKGGEETTVYVYEGQSVLVEEVKNGK